jgi:hypothetical protein
LFCRRRDRSQPRGLPARRVHQACMLAAWQHHSPNPPPSSWEGRGREQRNRDFFVRRDVPVFFT